MRFPLAAAALLVGAAMSVAQTPPQPGAPAQPDPVDEILDRWEKAMGQIDSFVALCNRTTKDKVFKTDEKYEGQVRYLKGSASANLPPRASLELVRKDRPEVYEKLVCTGNVVYEYVASDKAIRVYELPKNAGVGDDNFLQFVFGMKAAQAKSRYKIVYAGKDEHYHYLDVFPTQQKDMAEFAKARLVFVTQTNLPRQVWFLKNNQNEITWDFPRVWPQANLTAQNFPNPQLPQGWQWQRMPTPGQNPPAGAPNSNLKPTVRFNNGQ